MSRDEARLQYQLGSTYHDKRQFELAVAHYRKAIQADSTFKPVYNDIAAALGSLGRYEEAIPYAKKVLEESPSHWPALGTLVACLSSVERYHEARLALDGAVAGGFDPVSLPRGMMGHIAMVYFCTGDKAKCIQYGEIVLQDAPNNYECTRMIGVACFETGQFARGLGHYLNGLKHRPNCPALCLGAARCYHRLGRVDIAIKYARLARTYDPAIDLGGMAWMV